MKKLVLRPLKASDKDEFLRVLSLDWNGWDFPLFLEERADGSFETYLDVISDVRDVKSYLKGLVPGELLFAFDSDGVMVGRLSLRFELNEGLKKRGGHIGYGVSPDQRKKGYASEILGQALQIFKKERPSIEKALVTCDETNIASRKTIEKNGGEFVGVEKLEDVNVLRFEIRI